MKYTEKFLLPIPPSTAKVLCIKTLNEAYWQIREEHDLQISGWRPSMGLISEAFWFYISLETQGQNTTQVTLAADNGPAAALDLFGLMKKPVKEMREKLESLALSFQAKYGTKSETPITSNFNLDSNYETNKKTTSNNAEKEIFISYSWGGESERLVNQMDDVFRSRGITIIRDKRELGYKGRIKEFMQRIGRGRCVVVVISDKYLKSPNCMYELVQIAKHGRFYDRIFPIVLSDAGIYDPIQRIQYIKYWEGKRIH